MCLQARLSAAVEGALLRGISCCYCLTAAGVPVKLRLAGQRVKGSMCQFIKMNSCPRVTNDSKWSVMFRCFSCVELTNKIVTHEKLIEKFYMRTVCRYFSPAGEGSHMSWKVLHFFFKIAGHILLHDF